MPYKAVGELPDNVRSNLPEQAQEIYLAAYNNAADQYADPEKRRGQASLEEVVHRVAWAAVKKKYRKDRKSGEWVRRASGQ